MKILSIIGTRPEAIKMASVINKLKKTFGAQNAQVCITAQHRRMLDQVLALFKISADYDLNIMRPNQSLAEVTTAALSGVDQIIKQTRPDVILVHGDTTTTMAASLAAFYNKVYLGHVEAGLRSNNIHSPWPEEMNRRVAALIADVHFAPTSIAAQNLLREGIPEHKIVITGNTVIDSLLTVDQMLDQDAEYCKQARLGLEFLAEDKKIILLTTHRRENFGAGLQEICEAVLELSFLPEVQIVCPVHLNPNVRNFMHSYLGQRANIFLIEPLEYLPFVYLMKKSCLILTDSGGIQEEAPYLGKPVLVLRSVTERQEGLNSGGVKLVGTDKNKIVAEASKILANLTVHDQTEIARDLYGDGHAAERIVNKLLQLDKNLNQTKNVLVDAEA